MHFDKPLEPEFFFGDRAHLLEREIVEDGGDQKNGVGAGTGRFVDLDRVKDEILSQDRQPRVGPNHDQIIDRTGKIFFVGQNGDGARATALIGAGHINRRQIVANHTAGRRHALEFGNDLEHRRAPFPRFGQTMSRLIFSLFQRPVPPCCDILLSAKHGHNFPFLRNDFRKKIFAHSLRFVSRMSASSFAAACPLSMLRWAKAVAVKRSGAISPTFRAAAAFTITRSRAVATLSLFSPWRIARMSRAFSCGPPPRRSSRDRGSNPKSRGEIGKVFTGALPSNSPEHAATIVSPASVTSSRPSLPWTTQAFSTPTRTRAVATRSSNSGSQTPRSWNGARAGLTRGPSRLKTVWTPS